MSHCSLSKGSDSWSGRRPSAGGKRPKHANLSVTGRLRNWDQARPSIWGAGIAIRGQCACARLSRGGSAVSGQPSPNNKMLSYSVPIRLVKLDERFVITQTPTLDRAVPPCARTNRRGSGSGEVGGDGFYDGSCPTQGACGLCRSVGGGAGDAPRGGGARGSGGAGGLGAGPCRRTLSRLGCAESDLSPWRERCAREAREFGALTMPRITSGRKRNCGSG